MPIPRRFQQLLRQTGIYTNVDPELPYEFWTLCSVGEHMLGRVKRLEGKGGDMLQGAFDRIPVECSVSNPVIVLVWNEELVFLPKDKFEEITASIPVVTHEGLMANLNSLSNLLHDMQKTISEEQILLREIQDTLKRL